MALWTIEKLRLIYCHSREACPREGGERRIYFLMELHKYGKMDNRKTASHLLSFPLFFVIPAQAGIQYTNSTGNLNCSSTQHTLSWDRHRSWRSGQ